jgi:hypothetical protein
LTALDRLFVEEVLAHHQRRARGDGLPDTRGGAVTFVQRFGGSLNLNIHFHVVVLDGVFERSAGGVVFHEAAAPSQRELDDVLSRTTRRILTWLRRHGHLVSEHQPDADAFEPSGTTRARHEERGARTPCSVAVDGPEPSRRSSSSAMIALPPSPNSEACTAHDEHQSEKREADGRRAADEDCDHEPGRLAPVRLCNLHLGDATDVHAHRPANPRNSLVLRNSPARSSDDRAGDHLRIVDHEARVIRPYP